LFYYYYYYIVDNTRRQQKSVKTTKLHGIDDRAFLVAAARNWKSAVTCHVCTLYDCFPRSPQGFPFQAFLPMTFTTTVVVPAQW